MKPHELSEKSNLEHGPWKFLTDVTRIVGESTVNVSVRGNFTMYVITITLATYSLIEHAEQSYGPSHEVILLS